MKGSGLDREQTPATSLLLLSADDLPCNLLGGKIGNIDRSPDLIVHEAVCVIYLIVEKTRNCPGLLLEAFSWSYCHGSTVVR